MGEDRAAEKSAAPADRLPAHPAGTSAPAVESASPSIGAQRIPELAGNGGADVAGNGAAPGGFLRAGELMQLQALAGNRAVSRLVQRSALQGASVPPALQRQSPEGAAPAGGAGPSVARKHTFKLPEKVITKKFADSEYGEIKDVKVAGEVGLEPVTPGGGDAAVKGGVVLGPGEAGLAAETAEREIDNKFVNDLGIHTVKGVAAATTKEVSVGVQADYKGDLVTTEAKLNLIKLDLESADVSILPLTFTHHWEKFYEFGPIAVGSNQYKVAFKPLVEWTAALKWSRIGRDIAEKIGPEVLVEAGMTFGLIAVAVGVVAGTAYELYYADEFRELPAKMHSDTVFASLATVRGVYGDPGYAGEPYETAHKGGRDVRTEMEKKLDPNVVQAILSSGVRKDVMLIVDKVPYDALFDTAYKRAVKTWTDRHSLRASIIGVPGTITRLNQNRGSIDEARGQVRDYVLGKTADLPR